MTELTDKQGKAKPDSMMDVCFTLIFIPFVTLITERILSIVVSVHNGLPQGNLSLCLNVKVTLFSSQGDILTLPTCEWLQTRRIKHISSLILTRTGDILQDLWLFNFIPHLPCISVL